MYIGCCARYPATCTEHFHCVLGLQHYALFIMTGVQLVLGEDIASCSSVVVYCVSRYHVIGNRPMV